MKRKEQAFPSSTAVESPPSLSPPHQSRPRAVASPTAAAAAAAAAAAFFGGQGDSGEEFEAMEAEEQRHSLTYRLPEELLCNTLEFVMREATEIGPLSRVQGIWALRQDAADAG